VTHPEPGLAVKRFAALGDMQAAAPALLLDPRERVPA